MANMYSNHFNSGGSSGTGTPGVATLAGELPYDSQRRIPAGLGHSRLRTKVAWAQFGTAAGAGDVIRMMSMKSGDRIAAIRLFTDGLCTDGTADLGVYLSGQQHDGAVIDADLFGAAHAIKTAASFDTVEEREAVFLAGALSEIDRYKTLWELCAVGAASYTVDPMVDMDICLTIVEAVTAALVKVIVAVDYTAAD